LELVRTVAHLAGSGWWALVFLGLFGLLFRTFLKTMASQAGFNELAKAANPDVSWIEKYRYLLRIGLDKVESFLSPHQAASRGILSTFDAESFEKFFIMAAIYPVVSTVYNYFKFEDGAQLGQLIFFPGTDSGAKRIIALAVFVGSIFISLQIIRDFRKKNIEPARNVLLPVNIILIFVTAMMIVYPFDKPYNFFESLIGSVGVSCLYTGSLLYVGTGRCSKLLLCAAVCAATIAFKNTAVVGVLILIAVYYSHHLLKRAGKLHLSMTLMPLVLFAMTGYVIYFNTEVEWKASAVIIVVFGVILSTTNGLFDWLSVSVTRLLLRLNLTADPLQIICYTVLDFIVAFFLVACLIFSSGALISFANQLAVERGAACILDLSGFVDSMVANSDKYRWLYVTLYSTILPSLLHCYLMLVALSIILVGWILRKISISKKSIKEIYYIRVGTAAGYSLLMTGLFGVAIILPLMLMLAALENENLFRSSVISLFRLGISVLRSNC